MKYFSEALNAALKTINWSPSHLSERAGLDTSQIFHYCNGLALPEVDLLNQILQQFGKTDRLKLIVAYFQDTIPSEVGDVIKIKEVAAQQVTVEIGHGLAATLPEDLLSALSQLQSDQPAILPSPNGSLQTNTARN